MRDTVDHVKTNLSALETLLDVDNVKDIKKRISNLIVERVASDIRSYDYYLFYPGDYQEAIGEAFESVQKKIVKMYKDSMLEAAQEAVLRFKDVALSEFDEVPGIQLRSCHSCEHHKGNRCAFYEDKYWKAHDSICAEEGFINYIKKQEKGRENVKIETFRY